MWRHDRAHYRLVYPLRFRPALRMEAGRYLVADLSEQGIRFIPEGDAPLPAVGEEFAGTLRLQTGEVLELAGTVVRHDPPSAGAQLARPVPFKVILDQQRYLQRRLVAWS